LGNIGVTDVYDAGEMTKKALESFPDQIDPTKLGVYGGSHGGFLTSWLVGHPDYKDLYAAAVSWNPVLNMSYMVASTDIPDWMYACCKNEPHNYILTA
jgi:acylaminoacyl-peptidase